MFACCALTPFCSLHVYWGTLKPERLIYTGAYLGGLPRRGSPLSAVEPPNRQNVKYAHALDPRALELFSYNTFCKKNPLNPSELSSKGQNFAQISSRSIPPLQTRSAKTCAQNFDLCVVIVVLGSPPKHFLATRVSCI